MVYVVESLGGNAVNPPLSAVPPIRTVLGVNCLLLDEADDVLKARKHEESEEKVW